MKEKRFEQLDKAIIQVKNSNNLKKNVKPFVIDFIDDVRNENAKRDTRENKW